MRDRPTQAPFGVTSIVATILGPMCAAALFFLWPVGDIEGGTGAAALVVLEPLGYAALTLLVAAAIGGVMAAASLLRRERPAAPAIAALVVNALVIGAFAVLYLVWAS